jgi:hypothetical protein
MCALHQPIHRRLRPLLRRGQASGDFNPDLPLDWMITVLLELIHAASRELASGRLPAAEAEHAPHAPRPAAGTVVALIPQARQWGICSTFLQWSQPGSNRRPPACKASERVAPSCLESPKPANRSDHSRRGCCDDLRHRALPLSCPFKSSRQLGSRFLGTSHGGRVEIQLAPSFRAIRGSVPPRPVSYLLPKQNVRDEVHLLVASSSMLAKNASTPAFEPAIYSSTSSSPLAATSSSTAADTSWSNNSRPRGSSA